MAKVMLVEDDNNLRQIYQDRLAAEGYTIVAAADGEEALALAVKEKPDLIIADIMMPKVSGFDMLDILRSTPETKDAKIIMMTALSQAEDKTRAEKLGADKYLVKSQVTLEDVVEVAAQMLSEPVASENIAATGAVTTEPSKPAPTPPSTASIPVASAPTESTTPLTTSVPLPQPSATPLASPQPAPATTTPTVTPITITTDDADDDGSASSSPSVTSPQAASEAPTEDEIKGKIDEFIASNPTLSSSANPEAPTKLETTVSPSPVETSKPIETSAPGLSSAPTQTTPKSIPITTSEPQAEEKPAAPITSAPAAAPIVIPDQSAKAMAAVDGLLEENKSGDNTSADSSDTEKKSTNEYVSDSGSKSNEPEAQSMTHTKRIEPITGEGATQVPNINELLAQETDHDTPAPPPVNSVITPGGGSISPLPGSSVSEAIAGGGAADDTPKPDDVAL